jgi:aspartate/methionine/tyrosine aminotransferase
MDNSKTKHIIDRDDIVLGSGCAGLLNGLFFSLLEAGEAVLLPAPYYAAFESDMKVVAECVPVQVFMSNPATGPTVEELEVAYMSAFRRNLKVRMLLLTNPNNPLGTIYSGTTVKNAIDWARGKCIHTVVDEIYGLSIHDKDNQSFQSVTKVLDNKLGDDVHFLWALSKDFGASGFRVGVLYTQNKALSSALSNLNIFSSVSQPMQGVIAALLDDEEFVDTVLDRSRILLKASYQIVTDALREMDIPYVEAHAGIFVYCDFSSWLPSQSFQGEGILERFFQEQVRIVMTPGESQRDNKPGMFRICYAWVSPNVLTIAMNRLKLVASDFKNKGSLSTVLEGCKEAGKTKEYYRLAKPENLKVK